MQTDYLKRAEEEQKKYQQTRDPFEYGRQVAQRRYSEIMSGLDTQQAGIQQSYSDRYLQQQRAFRGQAAAGRPTFSGGMAQQGRDFITAAEQSALAQTMTQGMNAEAQISQQRQAAFSNAQLEGQQATQMQLQNQQTQLQLVQQKQQILSDTNLSEAQRLEQLQALGLAGEDAKVPNLNFGQYLGQALTVGVGVLTVGKIAADVAAAFSVTSPALTAAVGTVAKYKALGSLTTGVIGKGIAAAVMAHPYVAAGLAVLAIGGLIYAGVKSAQND